MLSSVRFSALFCIQAAGFEGRKFTATISVLTARRFWKVQIYKRQKIRFSAYKNEIERRSTRNKYRNECVWNGKIWEESQTEQKYYSKAMYIRCVLLIFPTFGSHTLTHTLGFGLSQKTSHSNANGIRQIKCKSARVNCFKNAMFKYLHTCEFMSLWFPRGIQPRIIPSICATQRNVQKNEKKITRIPEKASIFLSVSVAMYIHMCALCSVATGQYVVGRNFGRISSGINIVSHSFVECISHSWQKQLFLLFPTEIGLTSCYYTGNYNNVFDPKMWKRKKCAIFGAVCWYRLCVPSDTLFLRMDVITVVSKIRSELGHFS